MMMQAQEWVRDHAIVLPSCDPEDRSGLVPLRALIGDASIVAIGESNHFVHESYLLKDKLFRFLASDLGFTAFVMESGFAEGLAVNAWVHGGPGNLDDLLRTGFTYAMGGCAEMGQQLLWMREWNASNPNQSVSFYGMDVSGHFASAKPAVEVALAFLEVVDPEFSKAYAELLLPLLATVDIAADGVPAQTTARASYAATPEPTRNLITTLIADLVARLSGGRVAYTARSSADAVAHAYRAAISASHMDTLLRHSLGSPTDVPFQQLNYRDAFLADTVEWILEREPKVVIGAHNGHLMRTPFNSEGLGATTAGTCLAAAQRGMVVIGATCRAGASMTVDFVGSGNAATVEELPEAQGNSIDALLGAVGVPIFLVDLRELPPAGAVRDEMEQITHMRVAQESFPVDVLNGFDVLMHVDTVSYYEIVDGLVAGQS
jgi:erythromycin esterase